MGVGCHALIQGIFAIQRSNPLFPVSPVLAGGFFTTTPPGKSIYWWASSNNRKAGNQRFSALLKSNGFELALKKYILVERTFGGASKEMDHRLTFFPTIKSVIFLVHLFLHIPERTHVYVT